MISLSESNSQPATARTTITTNAHARPMLSAFRVGLIVDQASNNPPSRTVMLEGERSLRMVTPHQADKRVAQRPTMVGQPPQAGVDQSKRIPAPFSSMYVPHE